MEVHGVVISEVVSRVTILITHIRGLIAQLVTIHEPPSRGGKSIQDRGQSHLCTRASAAPSLSPQPPARGLVHCQHEPGYRRACHIVVSTLLGQMQVANYVEVAAGM